MFRHQPVLSMADGSIAGCLCLDRVFAKGREDWGTHLASIITARLEPQALLSIRDDIVRNGGRADAAVLAGLEALALRATGGGR